MSGGAEIVERAEDVVVIARREGELEEFGAGDFSAREAAKEVAFEQILFAAMKRQGNLA